MALTVRVKNNITPALERFSQQLPGAMSEGALELRDIIGAKSVVNHMRTAFGEPKRRSPLDDGPLRIVSGRLASSMLGPRQGGSDESVVAVQAVSGEVRLFWKSLVPYALIHEKGGFAGVGGSVFIPARPYQAPAVAETEGDVQRVFGAAMQKLAREVGL